MDGNCQAKGTLERAGILNLFFSSQVSKQGDERESNRCLPLCCLLILENGHVFDQVIDHLVWGGAVVFGYG